MRGMDHQQSGMFSYISVPDSVKFHEMISRIDIGVLRPVAKPLVCARYNS